MRDKMDDFLKLPDMSKGPDCIGPDGEWYANNDAGYTHVFHTPESAEKLLEGIRLIDTLAVELGYSDRFEMFAAIGHDGVFAAIKERNGRAD